MGVTDSEDEAETAEDLERIEAAAAAINQHLPQSSVTHLQDEIQVSLPAWCFQQRHMMCPLGAWLYRQDLQLKQHRLSLLPSLYTVGKKFFVGRVRIMMTCAGHMHLTLSFLCLFVACLPLGSGVYSPE